MKLSEAIRLGATMKPQIRMAYHSTRGTCAIGSALDACGELQPVSAPNSNYIPVIQRLWGWAYKSSTPCPKCAMGVSGSYTVIGVAVHLNDSHMWTREQIADFVELLEPLPVEIPAKGEHAEEQVRETA